MWFYAKIRFYSLKCTSLKNKCSPIVWGCISLFPDGAYWATGASTLCTGQDSAFFILKGASARMSLTEAPNIT